MIGWKYYLVFISVLVVGSVWSWFNLPETKGIPLEEVAGLFGDDGEVVVHATDLRVDHNTHQLITGYGDDTGTHAGADEESKDPQYQVVAKEHVHMVEKA